MALVGLIRLTAVSRLLGVGRVTALRWCAQAGIEPVKSPVVGMPGRTGTGINQPLYVSLDGAVRLVDLMLPSVVDRRVAARTKRRMREKARDVERSTKGVRHQAGGTGSGTPPSNLALADTSGIFTHPCP